MRLTTGARVCNFLTSFQQFLLILNYSELFWTIWSIFLVYFSLTWALRLFCAFWTILGYLRLSRAISGAIWGYLGLSWNILGNLRPSWAFLSQLQLIKLFGYWQLTIGFLSGKTSNKDELYKQIKSIQFNWLKYLIYFIYLI